LGRDVANLAGYFVTIQASGGSDGIEGPTFDAVEKLGLKREPGKVTIETIAVDQVSTTPSAI
jgi:hypothetical protein